jgi:hypothetical protein
MKRFLTTIKKNTDKTFISEIKYLTKMSHAHAFNTYNDDDKDIIKSLSAQTNTNTRTINIDNHDIKCVKKNEIKK